MLKKLTQSLRPSSQAQLILDTYRILQVIIKKYITRSNSMSLELFCSTLFQSGTVCKGSRTNSSNRRSLVEWLLMQTKPYGLDAREQQIQHSAIGLPQLLDCPQGSICNTKNRPSRINLPISLTYKARCQIEKAGLAPISIISLQQKSV